MKKLFLMDRFMSLCYDLVLNLIIIGLIILGVSFLNISGFSKIVIIVIAFLVIYLFVTCLLSLKLKGTVGKYLNDLTIEPTLGKITFGRMLFREVILKHLLYITVIGLFVELVFFLTKKQTIHDYYLKTKVFKIVPIKKEQKNKLFSKNK